MPAKVVRRRTNNPYLLTTNTPVNVQPSHATHIKTYAEVVDAFHQPGQAAQSTHDDDEVGADDPIYAAAHRCGVAIETIRVPVVRPVADATRHCTEALIRSAKMLCAGLRDDKLLQIHLNEIHHDISVVIAQLHVINVQRGSFY